MIKWAYAQTLYVDIFCDLGNVLSVVLIHIGRGNISSGEGKLKLGCQDQCCWWGLIVYKNEQTNE